MLIDEDSRQGVRRQRERAARFIAPRASESMRRADDESIALCLAEPLLGKYLSNAISTLCTFLSCAAARMLITK